MTFWDCKDFEIMGNLATLMRYKITLMWLFRYSFFATKIYLTASQAFNENKDVICL